MNAGYMQTSPDADRTPSTKLRFLRSGAGMMLALLWLYMIGWAIFLGMSAFQANAGGWELGEWLMTGAMLIPIIAIPVYMARCARRNASPSLKLWLTWLMRIAYVSLILAMLDSWSAGTDRRAPLFSKGIWAMRDGGTRGYVGFGYFLTYYRRIGGVHGPEVWFWFTPFTVSSTTKHVGIRWIWQNETD